MRRSVLFLSAVILSALATPLYPRSTIAGVKDDLANVGTNVTQLNNKIDAFQPPDVTLLKAFAIHTQVGKVVDSLTVATTDILNVSPKPLSLPDGRAILDLLKGYIPDIKRGLTNIQMKKNLFASLPVNVIGIVPKDLEGLRSAADDFEKAFFTMSPGSIKDELTGIKKDLDDAFNKAIDAYLSFTPDRRSTITDIQTCITNVANKVTALNSGIGTFKNLGGNEEQAKAIHSQVEGVVDAINSVTTSVKAIVPSPMSTATTRALLGQLRQLFSQVQDRLKDLESKKVAFQALPVKNTVSVVHEDLVSLQDSAKLFEQALFAASPIEVHNDISALGKEIQDAFTKAIATFS